MVTGSNSILNELERMNSCGMFGGRLFRCKANLTENVLQQRIKNSCEHCGEIGRKQMNNEI